MTLERFNISFPNGNVTPAVQVESYTDPRLIAEAFGLTTASATMFISGGAAHMTDESIDITRTIVERGIVKFAMDHNVIVIDGGTEAGIMQMIGEARQKLNATFPLIGCAPKDKVIYPGAKISGDLTRTPLQDDHSHFVLVNADHWGAESDIIVGLTRQLAQGKRPSTGVLINGGAIAQYDIYIASARGDNPIPVVVLEGSGRTADSIASASKSGKFINAMVKAIIQGGKIELVSLHDGAKGIYKHLKIAHNSFG